ncbi:MAG: HU family DNA-binding protein [Verrucomicrobiota bacterium]
MNRAQLVEKVQKELGAETSKAAAERALNAVIDSIKAGVKKEKKVQLIGFGSFEVKKRAARNGINPKTGEKIKIKASKTVKFTAGADFKNSI